MQMKKMMLAAIIGVSAVAAGCKDDHGHPHDSKASPATTQPKAAAAAEHNRLPLGERTAQGLKLVATMDEPVSAAGGGEGAFDLVITGGKPKAVRFWVGTEDAEGSVKAKAEEETPDNWHTHADVPKPLPAGSKFWAEVEPTTGAPFKVSFDLKTK